MSAGRPRVPRPGGRTDRARASAAHESARGTDAPRSRRSSSEASARWRPNASSASIRSSAASNGALPDVPPRLARTAQTRDPRAAAPATATRPRGVTPPPQPRHQPQAPRAPPPASARNAPSPARPAPRAADIPERARRAAVHLSRPGSRPFADATPDCARHGRPSSRSVPRTAHRSAGHATRLDSRSTTAAPAAHAASARRSGPRRRPTRTSRGPRIRNSSRVLGIAPKEFRPPKPQIPGPGTPLGQSWDIAPGRSGQCCTPPSASGRA